MTTTEFSSTALQNPQAVSNDDMTHSALNTLIDGYSLTQQQSQNVFEQVINGHVAPVRLTAIVTAIKKKVQTTAAKDHTIITCP